MVNKCLATIAYEVSYRVGDTTTAFLARIKDFLNDRYDDALMRTQATQWTMASMARLGDSDIPQLGLGEVIKEGATADAWDSKRQYGKSQKHESKFEWKLANFIIAGDWQQINASFSRYAAHEE